jgi:Protein of unknown function (DUF998)
MLTENHQTLNVPLITRLLIACGAIGPILFILVFLVEGATRPSYSAWHNFVSDLSLSNQGWMQIANFLICGVLMLCFALGLRQVLRSGKGAVWGPLLLGIFCPSSSLAFLSPIRAWAITHQVPQVAPIPCMERSMVPMHLSLSVL